MGARKMPNRIKEVLTATERNLAVAEIVDRLSRYLKAVSEINKYIETGDSRDGDLALERVEAAAIQKFSIPEGVKLLTEECEWEPGEIHRLKPFIQHWVAGTLFAGEAAHMQVIFDEIDEIDYIWVFFGEPSWFYCDDKPKDFDYDALRRQWLIVGTRSLTKHRAEQAHMIFSFPGFKGGRPFTEKHQKAIRKWTRAWAETPALALSGYADPFTTEPR
jgi:hypothetical protein